MSLAAICHLDAMSALQAEHVEHVAAMETEFMAATDAVKANFQHLLEEMEGQGYHAGATGSSTLGTQGTPPEVFARLKDFLKRRMPEETRELVNRSLAGATLPASYGNGDAVDRVLSIWAGVLAPIMTPTSGVVPKRGREILTAILAACPSGLALHEAYDHHLEVWRESEEGQEIIHDFDDGRYEDWFLRFLSGRFEDPSRDPLLFLYKTMNLAELSASRNLDDFSDTDVSGDEEDSDDQVLLESVHEQAAKQVAEAELKKLGSDELLDQAAETAASR